GVELHALAGNELRVHASELQGDLLPRPGVDVRDEPEARISGDPDVGDAGNLVSVPLECVLLRTTVREPAVSEGIGVWRIAVEVCRHGGERPLSGFRNGGDDGVRPQASA